MSPGRNFRFDDCSSREKQYLKHLEKYDPADAGLCRNRKIGLVNFCLPCYDKANTRRE